MRPCVYSLLLGAGLCLSAFAQPVEPRSFPAQKLSRPPVIDGVVNPDEWAEAYFVERFWSPSRQQWGAFPTRAYIGYDSEAVYVAFICEDPDPSQIRAQETKRGGYLENDDTVLVLLEPQARGLEPYSFTVNARGAQADDFPAGTTENIRWRGDWHAATQLLPNGWSAEVRIPFRILRYPPKQTRFGVILERYIPRLNEIYTFPNMGAYYSTRRQSLWTGLELPPPRYPVILLPYFTGDSDPNRTHGRGGLDVRYIAGDPLTALLTVKPDFRNIAADVARVDFSYTEKVLAETRPFFQEGSEYLPGRAVFYSVRVQELNAGLKAFGALGDWRYGATVGEYAHNGRLRQFGVGRVRYQFAERSFVSLLGVRLQGDVQEDTLGALLDTQRITGAGRAAPDRGVLSAQRRPRRASTSNTRCIATRPNAAPTTCCNTPTSSRTTARAWALCPRRAIAAGASARCGSTAPTARGCCIPRRASRPRGAPATAATASTRASPLPSSGCSPRRIG
jgi:hypothetical protein